MPRPDEPAGSGEEEAGVAELAVATAPVTFETLCSAHVALLEAQAEDQLEAERVKAFIDEAAAAGVQIESVTNRDAVRSMLNYWSATLARLPKPVSTSSGSEPAPSLERQPLAHFDASQSPDLDEKSNPFVGLAAFDIAQSDVFFGRERVVSDLLAVVRENALVVISGASGSGKSSLVRAGLVGAIRRDAEGADWITAIAAPGRDPIASLVAALAPAGPGEAQWVEHARSRLATSPDQAGALVAERMGTGDLLLIVDQLEELFSLCTPEDRALAARALSAIASIPRAHVVVTIRDEYLEGERAHRALPALDLVNAKEFRVPPLDATEIRAAIEEPAARVGLVFQDGLVDRIIAEVGTDPAALPLLQYELLSLWRNRQGNRITAEVYEKVGGPATALSNAAQAIYDGFVEQARQNTKIIFQQLVRPSLVYEFVRDRVTRGELQILLPPDSINTVIRPFVEAGLIRITPGSDRNEDRIEIAHEALIRNWDLLRRWAGEVRDRERSFLEVDARAERWEESNKPAGYLLFGSALRAAEGDYKQYKQRARVDPVASARVEGFLNASRRFQLRLGGGLIAAVAFAAVAALLLFIFSAKYRDKMLKLQGAVEIIADQDSKLAADTGHTGLDDDAARQFIQMLLSRGTISPAELPAEFVDMTAPPLAISIDGWAAPFDANFLGADTNFLPAVRNAGARELKLPNLRLVYDSRTGLPLLAIAQADRSARPFTNQPNRLYAIRNLAGQPDLEDLAADGMGMARLIDPRDIAWGPFAAHAEAAANILPAMFPVRQGAGENQLAQWPAFSTALRSSHNSSAKRVIYLSGAVPSPARNAPPRWLWKIAVSVKDGALVADGFIAPAMGGAGANGAATIDQIEKVSGLDFSRLEAAIKSSRPPKQVETVAPAVADAPTTPASVFIHVRDVNDDQASAIRLTLAAKGLIMPPVQRVTQCLRPAKMRYFHPEDADAAVKAAMLAGDAIRAAKIGDGAVDTQQLSLKARRGNLELWLCGPGKP